MSHQNYCYCQSLTRVWPSATPWNGTRHAPQAFTVFWSLFKSMSIELWCYLTISCSATLFSFCLQSFPASVFSNELALHIRCPKYWSFSFSIIPSNEYLRLISFGMDWLDLLAVQGTLKSLLQHHNSKASVLQCSAFFMIQLSHPYMTTGKIIALTIQNLCQQSDVFAF